MTTQATKAIARLESELIEITNYEKKSAADLEDIQNIKKNLFMLLSKGRFCTPQELV